MSCGVKVSPSPMQVPAGSYILMDTAYDRLNLGFECALSLLTAVISRPNEHLAITDGGMKSATTEFGPPMARDIEGLKVAYLSEEHGIVAVNQQGGSHVYKVSYVPKASPHAS